MVPLPDCESEINAIPLLNEPYPTGSYLIYDYTSPPTSETNPFHFRDGLKLAPELRASGSRQLDVAALTDTLTGVAKHVQQGGTLYVVDLRQESHLFVHDVVKPPGEISGRAISWYADKDWANVWRSPEWIQSDETDQIKRLPSPAVKVFCLHKDPQDDHVTPIGYSQISVTRARSEKDIVADIVANMQPDFCVKYVRIHVTDHCAPSPNAQCFIQDIHVADHCAPSPDPPCSIKDLFKSWFPHRNKSWVHFHCHGGDGRTTTFLAMYDMLSWGPPNMISFPSLDKFAERQHEIFKYCLRPGDPTNWKYNLAKLRWKWLMEWREWIISNGLREPT